MFFGGWLLPFGIHPPDWVDPFVVLAKMWFVVIFFIWIRATLPRLRYDQLMCFGWKVLLPLATLNALVTAIVVVITDAPRTLEPPEDDDRGRRAARARAAPAAPYRAFGETLRGLKTTFAAASSRAPTTFQYPEEKVPVYPRFRGRHRLHRFEDTGLEKCVGCSLCAAACPADCIRVVAAENTPEQPNQRRRALRRGLRDQPRALHLLRLLRGRLPVRRDHDGQRLRDVRLRPLRPHLHQGDAARRALRAHAAARARASSFRSRACPRSSSSSRASAPSRARSASCRVRNPFYAVLALVFHLLSLAALFLLLRAQFVAAAQVVVYAGAVMVLYVFVVAYVGGAEPAQLRAPVGARPARDRGALRAARCSPSWPSPCSARA